ncbi:hypothetical protein MMC10_004877 [Thelotrema lepadinum]|nr:hypothetical protein [Thelotrema lepadinum]
MIKPSALLELMIYAVEYHSGVDSQTYSKTKEISSFRDLIEYVDQRPSNTLRAQVLSIVQSKSVAEESITLVKSAHALFELDEHLFSHAISAMLFVVLATHWKEGVHQERLRDLLDVEHKFLKIAKAKPLELPSMAVPPHPSMEHIQKIPFLVKPHLFEHDNAVNTTRPHSRPPKIDWVSVLYLPPGDGAFHFRLINSIRSSYKVADGPIDISSEYGVPDRLPEHTRELVPRYAIGSVARRALLSHCRVLNSLKDLTFKLKYDCRAHPTIAKIDWLLYAMDCAELIVHSAEDLAHFPEVWPADENWEAWGSSFHKDREFIVNAAQDLLAELQRVREQVSPNPCLGALPSVSRSAYDLLVRLKILSKSA